jgi:hypothetical protein
MAVATPLTKFSASPVLPVVAAMILMPSLAVFLGAGNSAPGHKAKQMKLVVVTYGEGTRTSLLPGTEPVSLVQQQAEQNTYAVAQGFEQQLWPGMSSLNDVYEPRQAFYGADVFANLFANLYYNCPVVYYWYLTIPAMLLALSAVLAVVKTANSIFKKR